MRPRVIMGFVRSVHMGNVGSEQRGFAEAIASGMRSQLSQEIENA